MADKHGLHFTTLPTAWVSGFSQQAQFKIGSSVAWVADQVGAQAVFRGATVRAIGAVEKDLGNIERLMTIIGFRLLEEANYRDCEGGANPGRG